jgi:two-component system, cell cycle sensor histidine kinase PleC
MLRSSNGNAEYKAGRRLRRQIAAFCAAIVAAICVLVAEAVVRGRNAAIERARSEAANLSAGLDEEVKAVLDGIASASELLKDAIEDEEAEGKTFDLARWKERAPELASPAIGINIIDAQGKLRSATVEHASTPVSYADRDFFPAHRDNAKLGLVIAQPVFGKLTKRMIIPATRRLNTGDGRFAGVLEFTIDPRILTMLYRKVDIGRTGLLNLFCKDGVLLAHYTSEQGLDMSRAGSRSQELEELTQAGPGESGTFVKAIPFDGTRRIYSWRKVAGYPMIAVAALGEAEALADANRQAWTVIGLGAAGFSVCLIMMLVLNRELDRRIQHVIALAVESKKAQQANQVKSAFLANMSHELRTPLNAILGFAGLIRDKAFGEDSDRYADYAGEIYCSGAHLLSLVNDVLDVSKIEAGKLELREEKIKIGAIVQESLAAVGPQAATAGVSVTDTTPEARVSILGDRTKLKQIIINLLSNAVKFTPSGGSASIAVSAAADGGLSVTIRDTGIGMSDEEINDALELFRQVDNSLSRRFEGTGLGLPLAVQLTELHGGTVTVESVPGTGTVVVVRFPASRITWGEE